MIASANDSVSVEWHSEIEKKQILQETDNGSWLD